MPPAKVTSVRPVTALRWPGARSSASDQIQVSRKPAAKAQVAYMAAMKGGLPRTVSRVVAATAKISEAAIRIGRRRLCRARPPMTNPAKENAGPMASRRPASSDSSP